METIKFTTRFKAGFELNIQTSDRMFWGVYQVILVNTTKTPLAL